MSVSRSCAAFVIIAIGTLAACSSTGSAGDAPAVALGGPVANAFEASAAKASVPRDLLVAIAKVEEGLDIPAVRAIEVENEVPAAGPLQLRRGKLDTLARGAALSGATEVELRANADVALEAGALVLAELGTTTGARGGDLASWAKAVEEMSGFADDAHRESYTHQIFATLARGGRFPARDGETVVLPAHPELPPTLTLDVSSKLKPLAAPAEFSGAEWIPTSCTNKCKPGRDGASVEYIIIHDTEGNWNASVATLQNDPGKSVQYIVGTDGRTAQFVLENTTAWHCGNAYYNQRSVGIEHVGYSTKPYTEPQYDASAKLVDYLATKYQLPRDRAHVIGHDQVPNGNKIAIDSAPCALSPKKCQSGVNYGGASVHGDPGIWEWVTYMPRFGGAPKCNDVTAIWNCNYDRTKAFRCVNDIVELAICKGGCDVKAVGSDDECHLAELVLPPGEPPKDPPTTITPDTTTPGAPASPNHAPVTTPEPAPESGEGGCAVTSSVRSGANGATQGLLVGLVAIGLAARKRRRS